MLVRDDSRRIVAARFAVQDYDSLRTDRLPGHLHTVEDGRVTLICGANPLNDASAVSGPEFWRTHALWPGVAFGVAMALIVFLDLDRALAHAFFFDEVSRRWAGGGPDSSVIDSDVSERMRAIAGLVLGIAWLATLLVARLRPWRRRIGFVLAALALSIGLVSGLKAVTNVDCPWDLAEFGGDRPYVGLLADRPDSLPAAQCFPGAHASAGFALVVGYFLLRDRSRVRAAWALIGAIAMGVIFSLCQESRGAHFLSHDLAAAAIVWFTQLLLYVAILKPKQARAPARFARTEGPAAG
jgi:membrane-associated PAP2 superfamily phosphatase